MLKSGQREVIKPRQLAAWERELLIDRLYPLHCRIFNGMERPRFVQQIFGTPARDTTIMLRKNRLGELIGYCAVHLYDHRWGQKNINVVRCQAGLLREYRGGNSMIPFVLQKILWFRLRHPLQRMVFFGALIHPSSYLLCSKYAIDLWPIAGQEHHAPSNTLLNSCVHRFGLVPLDLAKPLVVDVGLHTRDNRDDLDYWLNCNKPAVRFFFGAQSKLSRRLRTFDLNPTITIDHDGQSWPFTARSSSARRAALARASANGLALSHKKVY